MSSAEVIQWVVAFGVGAVFVEIVRSGFQRKKMGADAAKTITDAATVLLGPLHDRIKELELAVTETRHELDVAREQVMLATDELHHARLEVRELRAKVRQHGLEL